MTATFLQNATDFIAKFSRFLITKWDIFIIKRDSFLKMRRFYYKFRQLLQNVTFITKRVVTPCYIYQHFVNLRLCIGLECINKGTTFEVDDETDKENYEPINLSFLTLVRFTRT